MYSLASNTYHEDVIPEKPDPSFMDGEVYFVCRKEVYKYNDRMNVLEENCNIVCSLLFKHCGSLLKAGLMASSKNWQRAVDDTYFLLI